MSSSLIQTERRLITLFVGGAFLFLIIFEMVFLISRIIIESQFTEKNFIEMTTRMERRGGPRIGEDGFASGEVRRGERPPIGLGYIIYESGGIISGGQMGPNEDIEEYSETLNSEFLGGLQVETITNRDGFLFYKKPLDGNGKYRIFFREAGYPIADILRDILRFLILDISIILPFYFIGRYFVRETLKPVEENIDTMSHFIHDAGHELKTPLAIVSGNLQILRESKTIEKDLVEESITTIHTMSDSLDGLLELANLKKGQKGEKILLFDMFSLELEREKEHIQQASIETSLEIPKSASIEMDRKHFSLLFGNILRNAIIYNKKGGTIRIMWKDGTLEIIDTGIGMEEQHLKKIWERFFRIEKSGKKPGTGIGLSIAGKIIELYDWKVEVSSKKGKGTTFSIMTK